MLQDAAWVVLGLHIWQLLGMLLHRFFLSHFTVVNELRNLGKEREHKLKGAVVICGGSVAGLLAARVCSDHYDEVLVIDPDNDALVAQARKEVPARPGDIIANDFGSQPRARISQTNIIHITQVLNFRALERLFPKFRDWLYALDAPFGPARRESRIDGFLLPEPVETYASDSLPEVFSLSRGAYETLLRGLVLRRKNVRFIQGLVSGVVPLRDDPKWLETVTYRTRSDSKTETTQPAELIVDCSGGGHAGEKWLRRAGYAVPSTETYDPHMRYGTLEFTVDPTRMAKIVSSGLTKQDSYILAMAPNIEDEQRVLFVNHVEKNTVQILYGGWTYSGSIHNVAELGEYITSLKQRKPPPRWLYIFLDYLESGPENMMKQFMASSGPMYYVKYHEAWSLLPRNFIALGDAVMKLNPLHGQGSTKAMIGAIILNSCLSSVTGEVLPLDFRGHFFKRHKAVLQSSWNNNKAVDYALDSTLPAQGETLAKGAILRKLVDKINGLQISGDRDIARRRFEVMQWIAPPTTVLAPTVLLKILWAMAREFFKLFK